MGNDWLGVWAWVGVKNVCVCVEEGLNEAMWGLNTGGLTTAERSQGGVDPLCTYTHTRSHANTLYTVTYAHTDTHRSLLPMQLAS